MKEVRASREEFARQVAERDSRARLGYAEAAEYLGISVRALRRAVVSGLIPTVKLTGKTGTTLFERSALDAWVEASRVPARKGPLAP
ncbi:MAG: helix-turn-helix domain-containing protein [Micromonosporaceae bacterium]|nr:helix-turn-helix domain-containing protein [Micromonosporaceae bacterium]